jgi:hypothetical protein
MPYVIVKSKKGSVTGWRVRKQAKDSNGRFKYFSKGPLSLVTAKKQLAAIYLHERLVNRSR